VFPPFLLWCWLERVLTRRDLLNALWLLVPMIVIPLPWFLSVALREPAQLEHFFWKHNVMRYAQAFDHQQGWWFYIPVIFAGMFPTSLLLPSAAIYLMGRIESLRRMRTRNEGYLLLCAAWTIGFFSCSSAKLPTYILPALPPLSLLLGRFVVRVLLSRSGARGTLRQGYHRHLSRWLPWQIVPLMALAAIVAAIVEADLAEAIGWSDLLQWSLLATTLVAVYLIVLALRGSFAAKWAMLAASLPLSLGYILLDVYGDGTAYRSYFPEALAEVERYDRSLPDDRQPPIVWFGRLGDSTCMYLGEVPEHHYGESQVRELCRFAAGRPETVVVAIPRHARLIRERMPLDFQLEPVAKDSLLWRLTRLQRDLPALNATRLAEQAAATGTPLSPDRR